MTSYYTSLYYVNNPLNPKPKNSWRQHFWWYGTSCSKKRTIASFHKCHQRKRRTLWSYTV